MVFPEALLNKLPAKSYGTYNSRESSSSQLGRQFDPLALGEASARHTLKTLLNSARVNRLVIQSALDNEQLSLANVIEQLIEKTIKMSDDFEGDGLLWLTTQRTNTVVIEQLLVLKHSDNLSSESQQILATQLDTLQSWLVKKGKRQNSSLKRHYHWLGSQLRLGLADDKYRVIATPAKLPPGSPI